MSSWSGGKGSSRRFEDTQKYLDNYDRIFKKDNKDSTKDKDKVISDTNPIITTTDNTLISSL